eukprot:13994698-Ditylum_brightwellii.AAC.1
MFQQDYGVHLNKNVQLHHLMKSVSNDYIPKQSEIITAANVKKLLTKKLSNNILEELACRVKTSVTVLTKATSTQYSLDEFYPKKKSGIELLGNGTTNTYVPEVNDIPSTERDIVP